MMDDIKFEELLELAYWEFDNYKQTKKKARKSKYKHSQRTPITHSERDSFKMAVRGLINKVNNLKGVKKE